MTSFAGKSLSKTGVCSCCQLSSFPPCCRWDGLRALAVVGHRAYSFFVWNLFLAWIPFWLACIVYYAHLRRTRHRVGMALLAFSGSSFSPMLPISGPTWFTCARRSRDRPGGVIW